MIRWFPQTRHVGWIREPRWWSCFAVSVLTAVWVASAFGQGTVRDETVLERPRTDYDALGARVGGFDLFPSVTIGQRWDDNIYRVDDDAPSDQIAFAHPSLRALSRWSKHSLVLEAGARADRFSDTEDENNTDWFAALAGRVDIGRNTEVHAGVEARDQRESRGGAYSLAGGEPDTFEVRTASAGWRSRLNRLSVSLDGRYDDYGYDNPARRFRDRNDREWRGQAGYLVRSGHEVFLRATRFERRYDTRRAGLDRDSDGWEFAVGVDLDLGGLIFGELFAGYRRQTYEGVGLRSVERPSFGAALDWNPTPLTTVSARASRTVQETVLDASGVVVTQVEAGVAHELLRNLLLTASLDFSNNDYRVVAGRARHEGDIWGGEFGVRWLARRTLHVDVSYRYETRDSTIPRDDYGNHVASLALTLQL